MDGVAESINENQEPAVREIQELNVNTGKDFKNLKKYGKSRAEKTKRTPQSRASKSRIFKEIKDRLTILSEGAYQGNFILYSHFPNSKRPFNFCKSYGPFAKQFHTANKAQSIHFSTFMTAAWKDNTPANSQQIPSNSNSDKTNTPLCPEKENSDLEDSESQ